MKPLINDDRLFPLESRTRELAKALYKSIAHLPIVSPHGHLDPSWFALNEPFSDPVALFVTPDHYVLRMFYSQGIALEKFGIQGKTTSKAETDTRKIWRLFCENYYLFRATPSRVWLDHALYEVLGVKNKIGADTADAIYDHIVERLATPEFRPRALYDRFNIEVLATTDSALDDLQYHKMIRDSGWPARIISTFRPDSVVDPEFDNFVLNVKKLGEITNTDINTFPGYLQALKQRRQYFHSLGATATDHGHFTAQTANLSKNNAETLYQKVLTGQSNSQEAELFRAQMLTEMAKMSVEDGMVMQIHPGSWRNYNPWYYQQYGRDAGADIPTRTNFVNALKPLLDLLGNEANLSIILFTLDETTYSRELAPLAGHFPCLKLGPPWWFFDSVEGMRRYRRAVTETAGFYNTVGFNDDSRAFISIPARHDVSRRIECGLLAEWVQEHLIDENEAYELAIDLSGRLAKRSYKL